MKGTNRKIQLHRIKKASWAVILSAALLVSALLPSIVSAADSVQPAAAAQDMSAAEYITLAFTGENENEVTDAVAQYQYLNGTDAKLKLIMDSYGAFQESFEFLNSFSFQSLDLIMTGPYCYFRSGDVRLADMPLVALTTQERYSDFHRDEVFPVLSDLTLTFDGNTGLVFGRISARQMPALKHLRLEFDSADTFAYAIGDQDWYQFPGNLESVELLIGGEPVDLQNLNLAKSEEDGSQADDTRIKDHTFAYFLGMLISCCPNVLLNGMPLMQIPALQDPAFPMDVLQKAVAYAYACRIYDQIQFGDPEYVYDFPEPIYGKLLFAEMKDDWGITDSSLNYAGSVTGYRDHAVPDEYLATGLEDADMLIIMYEDDISVGFYTAGGNAYQVDTMMAVADLNTGTIYSPYRVASDDPPSTITVQTINGVPTGGSGYGEYMPEKTVELVMSSYDASVSAQAEQPAEPETEAAVPEETPAETVPQAAEPVPEETTVAVQPVPEETTAAAKEGFLNEVLAALSDPEYESALTALQGGEVITQGMVGENSRILQKMLVEFGCEIDVDSSAGPGTFGALNQVRSAFGLAQADQVDGAVFAEMLLLLLVARDTDGQFESLVNRYYGEGDSASLYRYLQGCAQYVAGNYYRAKEAFEESQYKDYQARAEACVQPWPGNGELWHNSSVYGSDMHLTFQVNSYDESEGMCFEVYTEDGTKAAVLFLTGSGSVTTMLPGGNYRIKDATGTTWYGLNDAFGRYGSYEYMSFYEFEDEYLTALDSGYEWTITVNVTEGNPDAAGVGSVNTDWDTWTAR